MKNFFLLLPLVISSFSSACSSSGFKPLKKSELKPATFTEEKNTENLETKKFDAVSGYVWEDKNSNGIIDNVRVIFAIDGSNSAGNPFDGNNIGDQDADGYPDTVFDAEVLALITGLERLKEIGKLYPHQKIEVAVVDFFFSAQFIDLDPNAPGIQKFVDISKIDEIVAAIKQDLKIMSNDVSTFTNFEAVLAESLKAFMDTNLPKDYQNYLLFLTDGYHNAMTSYLDDVTALKNNNIKINAIGVGPLPMESSLKTIDADWKKLLDIEQLTKYLNEKIEELMEPYIADVTLGLLPVIIPGKTAKEETAVTDANGLYKFKNITLQEDSVLQVADTKFKTTFPKDKM